MKLQKFWQGETYAIVKAIKASGNAVGIVAQWKEGVENWARMQPGNPDAEAAKAWLPLWQVRDAYTPEELSPIWPALAIAIGHTVHWPKVVKSAARLRHELDYARLPNFDFAGRQYYLVARLHHWQNVENKSVIFDG